MTIRRFVKVLFGVLLIVATTTALLIVFAALNRRTLVEIQQRRFHSYQLADELRHSSNDLTRFVRTYVATGDPKYEQYYRDVLAIRNGEKPRPEHYERMSWDILVDQNSAPRATGEAVPLLTLMQRAGFTDQELSMLREALNQSNELVSLEETAIRLMKASPPDQARAIRMVHDEAYHRAKAQIMGPIDRFLATTEERTTAELNRFTEDTSLAFRIIESLLLVFLGVVAISYPLVRSRVLTPVSTLQQQTRLVASDLDRLASVATQIARGDLKESFNVTTGPQRIERKDEVGELSRLHDSMVLQLQNTGGAIASITADLSRARNHLQEILNTTPIAVGVSVDGICRFANPRYREMFGVTVGQPTSDLYVNVDDRRRMVERLQKEGVTIDQLLKARSMDGRLLDVLCTYYSIKFDGEPAILAWIVDVTQMKEVEEALAHKYEELRKLENLRDNLTHMIVHDLRSPLTGIAGYLQLLDMKANLLDESQRRYVNGARSGTTTLIEMITSLLDVNRLESGEMPLQKENCDLREIAAQAMKSLEGITIGRDVALECPENRVDTMCDPRIMERVIANLLGNSLKFTPSSGSVRVVVLSQGERSRVEVRDTGYGISSQYLDRVFDKFAQVEARDEHKKYSTGLGLTFCKLATEAHGGAIGVTSEVGKGSTFWFELNPN